MDKFMILHPLSGEILLKIANGYENTVMPVLEEIRKDMEEIPDMTKVEAQALKMEFIRMLGIYDQLNASDVEEMHQDLAMEGNRFYKQLAIEKSLDVYQYIKKQAVVFINDTRTLAKTFLKADEELARKMDLR